MSSMLMADDDPAIRDLFEIFLSREGHHVRSVPGGKECLEILKTAVPDLIVLDIMMSPMDGWDTLNAIRNSPATRDIPVAMFSGKSPVVEDIRLFGGLIDDYLMKPMDFDLMPDTFAGIIERNATLTEELSVMKRKGLDPLFINEYSALRKSLYIYHKFSEMFEDRIRESETRIRILEEKLSCLMLQ